MKKQQRYFQGKNHQYISNNTIYDNDILHEREIQREKYNLVYNLKSKNKEGKELSNSQKVI